MRDPLVRTPKCTSKPSKISKTVPPRILALQQTMMTPQHLKSNYFRVGGGVGKSCKTLNTQNTIKKK